MSKKLIKHSKQSEKKKPADTPVVIYIWVIGLFLVFWLVGGEAILGTRPHPLHWVAGVVGGIIGIPVGWLWYRWRGDVI